MPRNVLVVNPGSTSDEVAFFRGDEQVFHAVVRYAPGELKSFEKQKVTAQFQFRKDLVLKTLKEHGIDPSTLHAVIGRGGLVKPIPSGTYRVGDHMLNDLRIGVMGDHPSNLGGLIAHEIAASAKAPSFIADPVVVDELEPLARYSGMPENPRISIFHALNQKRVARLAAAKLGREYEDCNLIVMHGGGGVSVGAHCKGRVVDVNNALDGEGPFSPERCGSLPVGQFAEMCFSGRYTYAEVKKLIKGAGGLVDLLGTSDLREVERRVLAGESDAVRVLDGMAYQIARHACALLPAFEGEKIDRVIITGGMARCASLMDRLRVYLAGLGVGITVYPGENEMVALVQGALRVLYGREAAREYAADAQVPAAAK